MFDASNTIAPRCGSSSTTVNQIGRAQFSSREPNALLGCQCHGLQWDSEKTGGFWTSSKLLGGNWNHLDVSIRMKRAWNHPKKMRLKLSLKSGQMIVRWGLVNRPCGGAPCHLSARFKVGKTTIGVRHLSATVARLESNLTPKRPPTEKTSTTKSFLSNVVGSFT